MIVAFFAVIQYIASVYSKEVGVCSSIDKVDSFIATGGFAYGYGKTDERCIYQ
jgi:hypothetical protein